MVALVVLTVFEGGDHLDVNAANRAFARSFIAQARIDSTYDGRSLEVPLWYDHPETHESPRVTMHLDRYDLAPRPSTSIAVEVSADDPGNLRPAGSARQPGELITVELIIAAGFVVIMSGLRLRCIQRTRRLIANHQPSFVMHGRLIGRRRARRPLLQLFALDAPPGSEPVCVVPIVSHGSMPIGGPLEVIDVKGWPRPFGAVVARRSSGEVLWPAARALASRFGTRPSDQTQSVCGGPPPTFAPPTSLPVALGSADFPSSNAVANTAGPSEAELRLVAPWRQMPIELLLLVAALLAAAIAIPVTMQNAAAADAVRERSVRTVALVAAHADDHNTVRFEWNGSAVEAIAPADSDLPYVIGVRYPVLVDPVHPTSVRMAKEPYNAVGPIAWALSIAGLITIWPIRRLLQRRAAGRLLCSGPRQEMEATEVCVTTRFVGVRLRAPGDGPGVERGLVLLPRCGVFTGVSALPVTMVGSLNAHERPLLVVGSTAHIPVTRMFFGRPITSRSRSAKRHRVSYWEPHARRGEP